MHESSATYLKNAFFEITTCILEADCGPLFRITVCGVTEVDLNWIKNDERMIMPVQDVARYLVSPR